jgi:hypothetical protein
MNNIVFSSRQTEKIIEIESILYRIFNNNIKITQETESWKYYIIDTEKYFNIQQREYKWKEKNTIKVLNLMNTIHIYFDNNYYLSFYFDNIMERKYRNKIFINYKLWFELIEDNIEELEKQFLISFQLLKDKIKSIFN